MKSSFFRAGCLAVSAVMLVCSTTSYAQQPTPDPRLIPGDADVIHDVSGIAIGMTCDEAVVKGANVSPQAKAKKVRNGSRFAILNIDGRKIPYTYPIHEVIARQVNYTIADDIHFNCVGDVAGGEVFEISRQIKFIRGLEVSPPVASLLGLFQEKYGVPTAVYGPLALATMFNRTGVIQGKSDACAIYRGGNLYLKDYGDVDSKQCSYALTFTAIAARDQPGSVSEMTILIRDYLRLENGVRTVEKRRMETTPVAVPKL